jgi:hypothetical protein
LGLEINEVIRGITTIELYKTLLKNASPFIKKLKAIRY